MTFLISVAGIVFCFGLVVFIHEFGHFFVAKKSGVQVDQFAFGFGKEIVGFKWGETRYSINWIPLGGYVKMAGEVPDDYDGPALEGKQEPKKPAAGEFLALPWYRRIPIVVAGPFMNYVLAVVVFFGISLYWGYQVPTDKAQVGQTMEGKPAQQAGLQSGDVIVEVEGTPVDSFQDLARIIHGRPNQATDLLVERDNKTFDLTLTPVLQDGVGLIGVTPAMVQKDVGVLEALKTSFLQCWIISAGTVGYLGQKIVKREAPKDISGPLGIGHVIVKAVKKGWRDFWMLIGFISVALGLINLFPIPMVDGGHLLFYVIEGIRGKPLSTKVITRANLVGFALLMTLVVFATTNDVKRIWLNKTPTAAEETKE